MKARCNTSKTSILQYDPILFKNEHTVNAEEKYTKMLII